jgi:hypothetical protein
MVFSSRTQNAEDSREERNSVREPADLLDDWDDRLCRFCACEDARAVGLAVQLEPFGQASDYVLPRHVPAEVFLKLGPVIAGLKGGASLKPCFEGLLGGFDLFFELLQSAAQAQKKNQLGLGDLLRGLLRNGKYACGFLLLRNG